MKSPAFSRYALNSCLAAGLLAGCGGSQPPIGTPGAIPQPSALATHAERGTSRMLPEAKREALLYVSDPLPHDVLVFSYPSGKQVGQLTGLSENPFGLCSDSSGDVFVTTEGSFSQSYIYEYAHAGTQQVATLSDPGIPFSCASDPRSGDLAVTNYYTSAYQNEGDIAVYQDAKGTPTTYADPNIPYYQFCAYDDSGNLFADGLASNSIIDELPQGSSKLSEVTLNKEIYPSSIQWNNGDLAIADGSGSTRGEDAIYQVSISGSTATVNGPTLLWSRGDRRAPGVQFWIQGDTIIGPDHPFGGKGRVEFWRYPKGGKPTKVIQPADGNTIFGVTLSVAK